MSNVNTLKRKGAKIISNNLGKVKKATILHSHMHYFDDTAVFFHLNEVNKQFSRDPS